MAESVNKIFKSSYTDAEKLKGDAFHIETKIAVDARYADNLFDIYNIESLDYNYMRDSLIKHSNRSTTFKQFKEMTMPRISKERVVDAKLSHANINLIFSSSYNYFLSSLDRRKFFNVVFLPMVICDVFGVDCYAFVSGLNDDNKELIRKWIKK